MEIMRQAIPEDADEILKIALSNLREDLRPYSIFNRPGAKRYLRDAIRAQYSGGDSVFVVYIAGDAVVGFSEQKRTHDTVHFNHMYVLPRFRRKGIARKLFTESANLARDHHQTILTGDNFIYNRRAREWFASLDWHPSYEQIWVETPLDRIPGRHSSWWSALDLPQANRLHAVYGFSRFTLRTPLGDHGVGRLGDALYKCANADILHDRGALRALHALDGKRALLYMGPTASFEEAQVPDGRELVRGHRLVGDLDRVLTLLSSQA